MVLYFGSCDLFFVAFDIIVNTQDLELSTVFFEKKIEIN
jgi:hypothetical protein